MLPYLEHIQNFLITIYSDSYSCMSAALKFTEQFLAIYGHKLKRMYLHLRMDSSITIMESERQKNNRIIEQAYGDIKKVLLANCRTLEQLFLSTVDLPQILPTLVFLGLDNNLPNLKILEFPKTFDDFMPIAAALIEMPESMFSPSLQSIQVGCSYKKEIVSLGKIFKQLVTALLPHLNPGQRISIDAKDESFDIEDYAMLVALGEPQIVINAKCYNQIKGIGL
ncbi:hypothetical protein FGO68_gene11610 [Halteria grandinella]|uniref:Uncharacterized protein n=1 Tax=Halteria grandinella TaxID=5974 RepID=A0A8J8NU91_HALGN|nr:hypothetical protein FGO68_gene11610 [Halteria grandinella]